MTDGEGGRVTLALLGAKLDQVLERLDKMDRCITDDEMRIRAAEIKLAQHDEQITQAKGFTGIASVIAGVAAAVIGVFVKP